MTETQKRIREYKKALPHLKERVVAVALLLAISVAMIASVSFAWVTLSQSPEVNGLATTISTNGNLEIALSNVDGLVPDESAVGDGLGSVLETNLKWGNLINLSHENYGLDYLTLRPAVLNTSSLLDSPLYSVKYGADGRVSDTISDFAYTNFRITESGGKAFFVPEDGIEYGVRAISSVTYDSVTGDAMLLSLKNAVRSNLTRSVVEFTSVYNNKDYMNAITGLAGVYLNYRLEDTDQDCTKYVEPIYQMMQDYITCLDYVGQTLLSAANLHHFVYCNKNSVTYTAFTIEQLNDGTVQTRLANENITLSAMSAYLNSYRKFYGYGSDVGAYAPIKTAYDNKSSMGWEAMRIPVNVMANIYTTTINGTQAQSISSSDMISLGMGGTKDVVVHSGLIVDMDKMLGTQMEVPGLTVTFMGVSVTADVTTVATEPYYLVNDTVTAEAKAAEGGLAATDAVAADTYGMALDFWLRTNAFNSRLTLEGELIWETRDVLDENGDPVLDDEGKVKTETVVVGYSGSNRIWEDDDPELPALGTSTTQGSGSCYVFYPSSPEDQKQSLELLSAMCVAFVDENGTLLAQADLDTSHPIEEAGRVLIPLQLRAKTSTVIDPETQEEETVREFYITNLTQNQPTRITAIVYMDGSRLDNSQVLAAGSINGHLNIQFGTDEDLTSVDNPDLKDDYYLVSISASQTEFTSFDPENPPKTTLTLTLNGTDADKITGNFVSFISATQGARQPAFEFTKGSGSTWTAEVEFTGAGKFQLRSVQIDGVDYKFSDEDIVEVNVPGVTVDTVVCRNWSNPNEFTYMTTDPYYQLEMEMDLLVGPNIRNPSSVQAVFAHESGQNVTMKFTQTNNGWVGKGNFITSGKYELNYVIIDGAYTALTTAQKKTMDLTLGVQVQVFLDKPVDEAYKDLVAEMNAALASATSDAEKETIRANYTAQIQALLNELYVGDPDDATDSLELTETTSGYRFYHDGSESYFMNVTCIITDDQGNELKNMPNVKLYYGIGASMANRTDTDMTWNSTVGCYEGELEVARPGTYNFQTMQIGTGSDISTITSAPSAPKIQAISPTPISYVGKSPINYFASVENISSNPNRWIGLVLRDAPSAEVLLTVRHTDKAANENAYRTLLSLDDSVEVINNGDGTFSYDLTVQASKVNDATATDWFFYVDAPHDGTWQIIDAQISSAFYKGTFYDGVSTDEGGTGYLTAEMMGVDMVAQNITTDFFTTVNFSVNAEPDAEYSKEFMTENFNKAIQFTLTDYMGNAVENAAVSLTYTWNPLSMQSGYSLANGTIPDAWKNMGGTLTASADGKTFTSGNLVFLLDGQYACNFSMTINGTQYEVTDFNNTGDVEFRARNVTVRWTAPDVQITGVTPNMNTTFKVNLGSGTETNALDGVKNYYEPYYANTYIYMSGDSVWNGYTLPQLTMELKSGYGNADTNGASVVAVNGSDSAYNRTFAFNGNNTDATQQIGGLDGYTRKMAGKNKTITSISMKKDGITFTLPLKQTITINQESAPIYLKFSIDNGDATVPATIISADGGPLVIEELPGVANWNFSSISTTDKTGTPSYYDTSSWTVAKSARGICNGKDGYYHYTRNERYYNTTYWETTTVNTLGVTTWTIGGTTYYPGQKVTISSSQTATGNITTVDTEATTYEVVYKVHQLYDEYQDGEDATSNNSGRDAVTTTYESGWTQIGEPVELSRTKIS